MAKYTSEEPIRHAWSTATDSKAGGLTAIEDGASQTSTNFAAGGSSNTFSLMGVTEAEDLVESLKCFTVEEVGCGDFIKQHTTLEKLNLLAHSHAQNKTDEFVLEAFLTFGKVETLVGNLIALETWRDRVLPKLKDEGTKINVKRKANDKTKNTKKKPSTTTVTTTPAENNTMRLYFTMYHEITIISLLEVFLFHSHFASSINEGLQIEIVDYVSRRMRDLSVPYQANDILKNAKTKLSAANLSERIEKRTKKEEVNDHLLDIQYKVAVKAVTIGRYLVEHFDDLTVGTQSRILDTHDYLVGLVPLVDEPPWTRRTEEGKWEKLSDDYKWDEVEPSELLKLTKLEAQCWLALYHLTCNKLCREKYGLNAFRKEQLLRLRKFLNDVVLDQLPVLADVMRYMDELAIMSVPEVSSGHGSALLMQQVASVREKTLKDKDWDQVTKIQCDNIWSKFSDSMDMDLRKISEIYNEDGIEDILGESKPFELTSLPIYRVAVEVYEDETDDSLLHLIDYAISKGDKGALTNTPDGEYKRYKLKSQNSGSAEDTEDFVVPFDARIKVIVTFANEPPHVVVVSLPKIDLPTQAIENNSNSTTPQKLTKEVTVGEDIPKKVWKQFGSAIVEKLVIQLQFVAVGSSRSGRSGQLFCYKFGSGFISQPIDTGDN